MTTAISAPPTYDDVQVVVPAPGPGAGNWAGAASAVLVDDVFWLTWRVRRPLTDGRGVSVVVARSDDGLAFEPVAEVAREAFGAESFERPVLVPLREGGWRLYLSCATPGSKHWWVDSLTADTVAGLPDGVRRRVHEGDAATGGEGPGDHGRRRRLRDVAVLPPARRARPRGPDDHAAAHQRRRARLDRPRRGARRSRRPVGRPRRPGERRAARRLGALRRPPRRGVQLVRDDRGRDVGRHRADPPRPAADHARRTPTAPSATPPPCRCPTAASATTSRPRATTARTTWSPACAELGVTGRVARRARRRSRGRPARASR